MRLHPRHLPRIACALATFAIELVVAILRTWREDSVAPLRSRTSGTPSIPPDDDPAAVCAEESADLLDDDSDPWRSVVG